MSIQKIVDQMPEKLSKKQATNQVTRVLDALQKALEETGEVNIIGFGKFEVRERPARMGINPQTKERIEIEAKKTLGFKPGKTIKDKLNKKV